jgi:hypothetical protein
LWEFIRRWPAELLVSRFTMATSTPEPPITTVSIEHHKRDHTVSIERHERDHTVSIEHHERDHTVSIERHERDSTTTTTAITTFTAIITTIIHVIGLA